MATAVMATDLTTVTVCDNLTADGAWTGVSAVLVPSDPAPLEGTDSVGGIMRRDGDTMTFTPTTALAASGNLFRWIFQTIMGPNLKTEALGGITLTFTGSTSGTATFNVSGNDRYVGGWELLLIDPYGTPDSGTAIVGNITSIAFAFGVNVNGKQVVTTSHDFMTYGNGFYCHGGTSGDEITFAQVAALDLHYLLTQEAKGVYNAQGKIQIGDSTGTNSTYMKSSGDAIVFQDLLVGDSYYEFKIAGNATGTTSVEFTGNFVKTAGPKYKVDLSDDVNVDLADISGGTFQGGSTVDLSTVTVGHATVFDECDVVNHNGADLVGATVKNCTGAIDSSAMVYDETVDLNADTEGMTFIRGPVATHAIELGLNAPAEVTLTGIDFQDYNALNAQTDSTIHVKKTVGTQTINLSGVTGNVTYKTDGATVVIQQSVPLEVEVVDEDTDLGINLAHVHLILKSDYSTVVLSGATNTSGIITGSFSGTTPADVVGWARQVDLAGLDYEPKDIAGTITSTGFSTLVKLKSSS